jgi:hypothetical protein
MSTAQTTTRITHVNRQLGQFPIYSLMPSVLVRLDLIRQLQLPRLVIP